MKGFSFHLFWLMKMKLFLVIIFLFYSEIVLCKDGPCPSLIQYSSNPTLNFVLFSLHGVQVNRTYDIVVTITFNGFLPSHFDGHIFPFNEQNITQYKLLGKEPVIYRIHFPGQKHFPTVTRIKVNERVLCRGQGLTGTVTKLNFQHTLDTSKFTADWNRWNTSIVNQENDNDLAIGCGPEQFTCKTGDCRHLRWLCDGKKDCSDGSDEDPLKCETICPPTDFRCKGSERCLPSDWVCDTAKYCSAAFDDSTCGPKNKTGELRKLCGTIQSYKPLFLGGTNIDGGAWPWLVGLFIKNLDPRPSYRCAGSLISSKTVLTSANCVKSQPIEQWLVVVGRLDFSDRTDSTTKIREVDRILIHPDFGQGSKPTDADIAIIIVKKTIPFSIHIRPICLWPEGEDLYKIEGVGTVLGEVEGNVVGFGMHENGNKISPELFKATVVSNEKCLLSNIAFYGLISNRTVCAGERNGKGPCIGDSGSGLMYIKNDRWTIRGLLSTALTHTNSTCNFMEYAVYTDVSKFTNWIFSEIVY